MLEVFHIHCGEADLPGTIEPWCHCFLLHEDGNLALVDTGPAEAGSSVRQLQENAGGPALLRPDKTRTAATQIDALGFHRNSVTDILLTHCDSDNCGGLPDFPGATLHLSTEEHIEYMRRSPPYLRRQFEHDPFRMLYAADDASWFGLPARTVNVPFSSEILLVPLFGHTNGHCGVAIKVGRKWLFHAGNACYSRTEHLDPTQLIGGVAEAMAHDNEKRRPPLNHVRTIAAKYPNEIAIFGYHDSTKFKSITQSQCPGTTKNQLSFR